MGMILYLQSYTFILKLRFFQHPLVQIHLAVFLWGYTAILGKLITIDTLGLVLIRMLLAAIGFYLLPQTRRNIIKLSYTQMLKLAGIGFIICMHWLCFYQSIKEYNSSSIALVCLGTSPMFVIWIEYIWGIQRRISYEKIIVSLIALVGMYFIANGNKLQVFHINKLGHYEWAIVYGVLSSFLASVFTIMNGKISQQIEPAVLSFVEMLAGGLCLLLFTLLFLDFDFIHEINLKNGIYILILSFLCTNVPFLLSIYALKKLEPFVVTLTVNLEPIYGLFFAAILFQEFAAFRPEFYLGACFILFSVFLPIIIGKWKRRKTSS
jgi:drug/metabolite transporter (DMT)-like permease